MIRLIVGFAVGLCLTSSAHATLSPSRGPMGLTRMFPSERQVVEAAASTQAAQGSQEFQVTDQTEVKLDGQPCKYEEVPNSAMIILLEVASEKNKVILKIHFQSKK